MSAGSSCVTSAVPGWSKHLPSAAQTGVEKRRIAFTTATDVMSCSAVSAAKDIAVIRIRAFSDQDVYGLVAKMVAGQECGPIAER